MTPEVPYNGCSVSLLIELSQRSSTTNLSE